MDVMNANNKPAGVDREPETGREPEKNTKKQKTNNKKKTTTPRRGAAQAADEPQPPLLEQKTAGAKRWWRWLAGACRTTVSAGCLAARRFGRPRTRLPFKLTNINTTPGVTNF
jgi:hypothetical protein